MFIKGVFERREFANIFENKWKGGDKWKKTLKGLNVIYG